MENEPIKITINYNQESRVEIQQWLLIKGKHPESDRISAEFKDLSYSLVLDAYNPRIEVWNLDDKRELKDLIAHFVLPRSKFRAT